MLSVTMLVCGENAVQTPLVFRATHTPSVRPARAGLVWKRTVIQVPPRTTFVAWLKRAADWVWPTAVPLEMVAAVGVPTRKPVLVAGVQAGLLVALRV